MGPKGKKIYLKTDDVLWKNTQDEKKIVENNKKNSYDLIKKLKDTVKFIDLNDFVVLLVVVLVESRYEHSSLLLMK